MRCLRWAVHLMHLPSPSCLVSQACYESTVPGVPCVSSGELISGCDIPGRCQPSRIPEATGNLLTDWWKMRSLGLRLQQILAFQLCHSPTSLLPRKEGPMCSRLALLSYLLNLLSCERARSHRATIDPFTGRSFLYFFGLSGDPTVWVASSH